MSSFRVIHLVVAICILAAAAAWVKPRHEQFVHLVTTTIETAAKWGR